MEIRDLYESRRQLIEQNRLLLDRYDAAGGTLPTDASTEWDTRDADIVAITKRIEREERQLELASVERERVEQRERAAVDPPPPPVSQAQPTQIETRIGTDSPEYLAAYLCMLRGQPYERRALEGGVAAEGGNLIPNEWMTRMIEALDEPFIMRGRASVFMTTSGTINLPSVTTKGTAAWTDEEAAYTEDDPAFGNLQFSAYKAARIIKISDELLQDNQYDLEGWIQQEFTRSVGALEETAFVNGDGTAKPTGVVQGSTAGPTAASNATIAADEIYDLFHSLPRAHRPRATWVMADGTIKVVRKLKDTTNQYLWQPGMRLGEPDLLLGRPVEASPDMPAIATVAKSVIFGDLSYYYIQDRAGISIQRLNELYAANGQVGFRIQKRTDGKLALATAVYHLVHPV